MLVIKCNACCENVYVYCFQNVLKSRNMFTFAASVQGMMSFPMMPCDDNHGRLELGGRSGRNFSQISSELMRGLAR